MSRVLITSLGSPAKDRDGNRQYRTAEYRLPPVLSKKGPEDLRDRDSNNKYVTPFIAAALAQHLEIDKIIFFGTALSMWEEVYRWFADSARQQKGHNISEEEIQAGRDSLKEKISRGKYPGFTLDEKDLAVVEEAVDLWLGRRGSKCRIIHYGLDESELMGNFDIIMQAAGIFEDGDELYLDITHSFCSLSLFIYLMVDYLTSIRHKKITVKAVFYGMLDVSGELGYTPVVDLTPVYNISRWIKGVYALEHYGNGYLVSELIAELDPKLAKRVRSFTDSLNISFLNEIRQQLKNLKEGDFLQLSGPRSFVGEYLWKFVNRFSNIEEDSAFQLELARWFFELRHYAAGYILLVESIITRVVELCGFDYKNTDEHHHYEIWKQAKKILNDKDKNKNHSPGRKELKKIYHKVDKFRINIAHALENDKVSMEKAIEGAHNFCDQLRCLYGVLKPADFAESPGNSGK